MRNLQSLGRCGFPRCSRIAAGTFTDATGETFRFCPHHLMWANTGGRIGVP